MYSQHNKPMEVGDLPDGYVINVYDKLHNAIAHLYCMLNEVKNTSAKIMTDSTRQSMMEELVTEMDQHYTVEMLLEDGWQGYKNMTDLEFLVDVQNTIAGWCGQEQDDGTEFHSPEYEWVLRDVEKFTNEMVTKAAENSLLDRFEKFIDNGYKE